MKTINLNEQTNILNRRQFVLGLGAATALAGIGMVRRFLL